MTLSNQPTDLTALSNLANRENYLYLTLYNGFRKNKEDTSRGKYSIATRLMS